MKSERRAGAAAAILLAVGLAVRLANVSREHLSMMDDAFYYFGIARQVVLGNPPSIDGVTATNGYHPLWLAILIPVYWLAPAGDLLRPIQIAMTIGAIFDTAAGALLWRIGRRLGLSPWPALVPVAAFVASRFQIENATTGLETPLALFLGLALLHSWLDTNVRAVSFGAIAGLCLLARTDLVIVVAALMVARVRTDLRWVLVSGGVACVVFLPWLAISWATTGTLVQSSGIALSVINDRIPLAWGFSNPPVGLGIERAFASMLEAGDMVVRASGPGALPLVAAVALFVLVRGRLGKLAPWLLALLLGFVAHAGVRMAFREWYTAPFIATFALLLGVLVQRLLEASRRFAIPALVGLGALWTLGTVDAWRTLSLYKEGWEQLPGMRGRVGASDSGVEAYFASGSVTNLDGVVNRAAVDALREGKLFFYLEQQDFDIVYLRPQLHSSAYLGARARESLVIADDPAGVRVARSEDEKNQRIGPSVVELAADDPAGREYLGDGWTWAPPIRSAGRASELIFWLVAPGTEGATLNLELTAVEVEQSVRVFLNDELVTTLAVPPRSEVHRISIARADAGRNRIRLEYAVPKPRRNEALGLAWWREADGHVLASIILESLVFSVGSGKQLRVSAAEPEARGWQGFHDLESADGRHWRWTNGDGRARIRAAIADYRDCFLRIETIGSSELVIAWNGVELPIREGAYPVARRLRAGTEHEISIRSETFVPKGSEDTRTLGVQVSALAVSCQ